MIEPRCDMCDEVLPDGECWWTSDGEFLCDECYGLTVRPGTVSRDVEHHQGDVGGSSAWVGGRRQP